MREIVRLGLAGFLVTSLLSGCVETGGQSEPELGAALVLPETTFAANAAVVVENEEHASVSLPANAFVLQDGSQATGTVGATLTTLDVDASPDDVAAQEIVLPDLVGTAENSNIPAALQAYSVVDFTFQQDGQLVQLAADKEATIRLPLQTSHWIVDDLPQSFAAGDKIPLWHHNQKNDLWEQEGTAEVVVDASSPSGFTAIAQVEHFSSWTVASIAPSMQGRVSITLHSPGGGVLESSLLGEYKVRISIDDSVAAWGANPAGEAWSITQELTASSNQMTVVGNTADRARLIAEESAITDWTRVKVELLEVVIDGIRFSMDVSRSVAFVEGSENHVEFDIAMLNGAPSAIVDGGLGVSAVNDLYSGVSGESATLDLCANDTFDPGASIAISHSGDVPTGMTLADCVLSGTPTAAGNYKFSYTVTDTESGEIDTAVVNVTISLGDIDTDGDGVFNSIDLDDDNDGILDTLEDVSCPVTLVETSDSYDSQATLGNILIDYERSIDAIPSGLRYASYFGNNGFREADFPLDSLEAGGGGASTANLRLTYIGGGKVTSLSFLVGGVDSVDNEVIKLFATDTDSSGENTTLSVVSPGGLSVNSRGELVPSGDGNNGIVTVTSSIPFSSVALGAIGPYLVISSNLTHLDVNVSDEKSARCGLDVDGDGIISSQDLDSDNDGINDVVEAGGIDLNGDGLADDEDGNSRNDRGVPSTAAGGITPVDSDDDGYADPYEVDSDDDGVNDINATLFSGEDSDGDGRIDDISDEDGDGIVLVSDQASDEFGDDSIDTDGDGVRDHIDLDDDNDGILDVIENTLSGEQCRPSNFRMGYVPNARSRAVDNGYTFDGTWMTGSTVAKLLSSANFGSGGTVETAIELVPINANPINVAAIEVLDLDVIFIGGIDNGHGNQSYLRHSETDAIKQWSTAADENLVIVTNPTVGRWGWVTTNNNVNPDVPTTAGKNSSIFDGPFGEVASFTQGGSLTLTADGGSGTTLAEDSVGRAVFMVDSATNDLLITDVDILTTLGGITNGAAISSNNDRLAANLFAFAIDLHTGCDTIGGVNTAPLDSDGDGIINSLDLDSDNDGINDVDEAGGTDINGDGRADDNDGDSTNDSGVASSAQGGVTPTDSDDDGRADPYEVDSDDNGFFDIAATTDAGLDADGDGRIDDRADADGDGIMSVLDRVPDSFGDQSFDTDGDRVFDNADLDDDNDGILDTVENSEPSQQCTPSDFRLGYVPNVRSLSGDNGYTFDGQWMTGGTVPKLQSAANFGEGGVVGTAINLVPINANPISAAAIDALDLDALFIGGIDNGHGNRSYLSYAETNAIRQWSVAADENLVIVTNPTVARWGWTMTNNNTNPDLPTEQGADTTIFDGPFGQVTSFTQGGSLTLTATGGVGTTLGEDSAGRAVFIVDTATSDLMITDVDILTSLGGISNGSAISSNNDRLAANLFAFAIDLHTGCDTIRGGRGAPIDSDGDGIINSLDLDSDNDGINDVDEAGGTDLDGDGMADDTDGDSLNDKGVPSTADGGTTPADSDDDGNADPYEVDRDNDGINDIESTPLFAADADGDGRVDDATDDDADGIMSVADLVPDSFGDQSVDTDGDGVFDNSDLDDDNDGMLDIDECKPQFSSLALGGADGTFEALNSLASRGTSSTNDYNSNVTGGGWRNSIGTADSWFGPMPDTGYGHWSGLADGTPASPDGGVFAAGGTWFRSGEAFYATVDGLETGKAYTVSFYQAHAGVDGVTPINGLAAWRVQFGSETQTSTAMPYLGPGNQVWQKITLTFTPTATSQRLEFFADWSADVGWYDYMAIDDVEVLTPVRVETGCDNDGDGIINSLDLDSDNDGKNDVDEAGGTDADSDGMADDTDDDSTNNNGIPSSAGSGITAIDSDNDGNADSYEIDSDNDGTNDIDDTAYAALDLDGDGRIDDTTDEDGDGIVSVSDLVPESFGDRAIDTDGDGVFDNFDLDDDNDGILDTLECVPQYSSIALGGADGTFTALSGVASRGTSSGNDYNSNVTGGGWLNGNGTADSWHSPLPNTGSGHWSGLADGMPASPDGGVFATGGTWFRNGEAFYTTVNGLEVGKPYNVSFYQANAGIDGVTPLNGKTSWRVVFGSDVQTSPAMPYLGEGNQTWQKVSLTFTPTSTSQRLEFFADWSSDAGWYDYMAIDGVAVLKPVSVDTGCDNDGDGIINSLDLDSDNDGINDVDEAGGTDTDGDGLADDTDGDGNNNGIPSTAGSGLTPTDSDNDGNADPYEIDSDDDGTNDIDQTAFHAEDLDGDGRIDDTTDIDADGIMSVADLLPDLFGDLGLDTDGDGVIDTIDLDDDNDGILDVQECKPQYSSVALGGADGTFEALSGFASRGTSDGNDYNSNVTSGGWFNGNGSADSWFGPLPNNGSGTWGGIADGMPASPDGGVFAGAGTWFRSGEALYTTINGLEIGKNYTVSFYQANAGVDGVTPFNGKTAWRVVFGDEIQTAPAMAYLGQGNQVWEKISLGFTPTSSSQRLEFFADWSTDTGWYDYMAIDGVVVLKPVSIDTGCDNDGDGIINSLDLDSDNDGINDVDEAGGTDVDGNGQADDTDGDGNNNGIPSSAGSGITPSDSDNDGNADPYEIDSDNDGTNDIDETAFFVADLDGDGRIDDSLDLDRDGIMSVSDLVPDSFGDQGVDTDSDGVIDNVDLDDDNDGILDADECKPIYTSIALGGADGTFEALSGVASRGTSSGNDYNSNVTGGGWLNSTGSADSWYAPLPLTGNGGWSGLADGMSASPDGGVFAAAGTWFRSGEAFYTTVDGLEIGKSYNVSFFQANAGVAGLSPLNGLAAWRVVFGAESQMSSAMHYLGEGNQVWEKISLSFTPTSSSQRLEFFADWSTDVGWYDYMAIDGVAVLKPAVVEDGCDNDGDGIVNSLDLDSDNDGINDVIEAGGTDADGDGMADDTDADSENNNGIPSTAGAGLEATDSDGDGVADPYEVDSNNDASNDIDATAHALLDLDGDGRIDEQDDSDRDGIMFVADALPNSFGE